MTAKDRIDNFIGFFPDVLKTIYNNPEFQKYRNIAQNNAYWTGYIRAKEELRNKLYEKENIPIPAEQTLYFPDENMELYSNIIEKIGEKYYERKN
jgi:hypothetical protein